MLRLHVWHTQKYDLVKRCLCLLCPYFSKCDFSSITLTNWKPSGYEGSIRDLSRFQRHFPHFSASSCPFIVHRRCLFGKLAFSVSLSFSLPLQGKKGKHLHSPPPLPSSSFPRKQKTGEEEDEAAVACYTTRRIWAIIPGALKCIWVSI